MLAMQDKERWYYSPPPIMYTTNIHCFVLFLLLNAKMYQVYMHK